MVFFREWGERAGKGHESLAWDHQGGIEYWSIGHRGIEGAAFAGSAVSKSVGGGGGVGGDSGGDCDVIWGYVTGSWGVRRVFSGL